MKKISLIVIFLGLLFCQNSNASIDFWDRASNQEHISSGYAIFLTSNYIYGNKLELSKEKSLLLATGTTFLLTYLRDTYIIKPDPQLRSEHLKATALGVSLGTVFSITFDF